MKKITKFSTIFFAFLMLITLLGAPLSAEEEKGTITIDTPNKGATYTIFKLLDLEGYKDDAYFYTIDPASSWYGFFTTGAGKDYVKIEEKYSGTTTFYAATWVNGADQAAFAKIAKQYAIDNAITDQGSITVDQETTISFEDLDLGYYLVGSSAGALCSLDTTDNVVIIHEKNSVPSVEKKVLYNGIPETTNIAGIGDELTFETIITAQAGAESYVLTDEMSAGLTLLENPLVSVKVGTNDIEAANYTFTRVSDQKFTLSFTEDYLKTITDTTLITVVYKAALNANAVIGGTGNSNTTYLDYGDDQTSATSSTTTYTYGFDIVKTKASNDLLDGAVFEIYFKGEKMNFVLDETTNTYRVATDGETSTTQVNAGKARIVGLGNGTYWIEEISAPTGYTPLDAMMSIQINGADKFATMNENAYTGGGIQIINRTGGSLPVTGGSGSTLLTIGAVALIIVAVSLVMAKKRAK